MVINCLVVNTAVYSKANDKPSKGNQRKAKASEEKAKDQFKRLETTRP